MMNRVQGIAKKSGRNQTRSRSGCGNCRQRHRKCDETRPHCLQCSLDGIECKGYTRKFVWKNYNVEDLSADMTWPRSTVVNPDQNSEPTSMHSSPEAARTPERSIGLGQPGYPFSSIESVTHFDPSLWMTKSSDIGYPTGDDKDVQSWRFASAASAEDVVSSTISFDREAQFVELTWNADDDIRFSSNTADGNDFDFTDMLQPRLVSNDLVSLDFLKPPTHTRSSKTTGNSNAEFSPNDRTDLILTPALRQQPSFASKILLDKSNRILVEYCKPTTLLIA